MIALIPAMAGIANGELGIEVAVIEQAYREIEKEAPAPSSPDVEDHYRRELLIASKFASRLGM